MGPLRHVLLGAVVLALVSGASVGGAAASPTPTTSPSPGPDGAPAPVDLGVFSGPVRFEAPDGTVLDLGERRYAGTVEASPRGSGLTLVDELAFDAYLEGLAEVPVAWDEQALRAQVVAARTYAWWELSQELWTDRGYDICATQACQVFRGRDIVEVDREGRWVAAVADTSGEVLLDPDGQPILARYSSSNGGASRANDDVFPADGAFPWLQPVDDPFDAVSPFHRWQVVFPRADFDALVAAGETLGLASPVAAVRLVDLGGEEDRVEVTGVDGTVRSVTASAFRSFVTAVAPDIDPAAYPPPRPDDASRRQPATLLSSQLAFTVTDEAVTVDGRGFGHAVGMSQYGMLGRAEDGQSYAEILAHYYGGIEPSAAADVPATVRVGIDEGLAEVEVRPSGPVVVRVGDVVVTERGLGTWRVEATPDRTARVVAPPGYGAPLVVDPTSAVDPEVRTGRPVLLETVVSKPVEATIVVLDADGSEVAREPAGVLEAGRRTVAWEPFDADGTRLPAGTYEATVVGVDETGATDGTPGTVLLVDPPPPSPVAVAPPSPADDRPSRVPLALGTLALAAGAGLVVAGRARGRR